MKKLLLLVFVLTLSYQLFAQKNPVKVACIGNSITFGAGIQNKPRNSYPAQLAKLLGSGYTVKNFGISGRTMLNKGNHPYMAEPLFKQAIEWHPDMVIMMLGTNDSKPLNWQYADEFESDYQSMITAFDTLPEKPKIYLVAPVPSFSDKYTIQNKVISNEIYPAIKKLAEKNGLHFIDLYHPFLEDAGLFPDGIHPDAKGAQKMAEKIYQAITDQEKTVEQDIFPGVKTTWHGFKKYDFEFERRPARLVIPDNPLPGNRWVWRARFPNWHYETDSILLANGVAIAYVNTNHLYGNEKAMKIWDKFYRYLTHNYQFNKKVALEGVSRGGLFVYNWAKRHPDKVICIYTEAPVCDIKSWPGGLVNGTGSKTDWQQLKDVYHFQSDQEAIRYRNNPIDQLDNLAAAKVPLMNMVGLTDSIVPYEENTKILAERYIRAGGPITVVPCTSGKTRLKGHHFTIESPKLAADFIYYYTTGRVTSSPSKEIRCSDYHLMRRGLPNTFIKLRKQATIRIAFMGGSITYNPGWRDSISEYFHHRFPNTKFEFIAAGIPSFGSTENAFRLERDILSKGPVDLLFVEAAVNDEGKGRPEAEITRAMEGIVRHTRYNNPTCDIVFMYFVDPRKIKSYNEGQTPDVIRIHDRVAAYYDIPALNLAKEVTDRINAGEFTWEKDFKNLHPSPFGQHIYARSMLSFLDEAFNGFVADDDKIENYPLPPKMDRFCYDHGKLIEAVSVTRPKGWKKVKNWNPELKARTRTNYIHVPMLVGDYPASPLTYDFFGTAVGVAVAAGPDAGILEYQVDDGPWKTKDLFTRYSKTYHLPWYYVLEDTLLPGKHTLKIKPGNKHNPMSVGNKAVIRYFFINEVR